MARAPVPLRVARISLVLAGCAALETGAWLLARDPFLAVARPLVADGPSALARLPFDDVVAGGCATVLLACAGWLLVTAALLSVTGLAAALAPGSPAVASCCRLAERACPRVARGVVVGLLGLGLGSGVTGPAHADTTATPGSRTTALDGLVVPDRTVGAAPAASAPRTAALPATRSVRVLPGDSLWSISRELLPSGSDDARIAGAWHRLHRANHSRIGDDPDLILPGTRLVVPDLLAPDRKEHP